DRDAADGHRGRPERAARPRRDRRPAVRHLRHVAAGAGPVQPGARPRKKSMSVGQARPAGAGLREGAMLTKSFRRGVLIGAVFVLGAGGIVADGLMSWSRAKQAVQTWTRQQTVPTVALAKIERGAATRPLTLPATIQPFYHASIYARVNGYLNRWTKD